MFNHVWTKGSQEHPDRAGKDLHPPVAWANILSRNCEFPNLVILPDVFEADSANLPDNPSDV